MDVQFLHDWFKHGKSFNNFIDILQAVTPVIASHK
jgi:hypothetical protein